MLVNFSEDAEAIFVDRTGGRAERQLVGGRDRRAAIVDYQRAARCVAAQLSRHGADGAALPAQPHRSRATTSSPRTTTSSIDEGVGVGGAVVLGERLEVGLAIGPPFPLLQAEKVLSLPLELRLESGLSLHPRGHRTDRTASIATASASSRSPTTRRSIAARCGSTGRPSRASRCRRCRSRTSAPVVSNEEIHPYEPGSRDRGVSGACCSRELTARQIILIAGRNLLLEKATTFTRLPRERRRPSRSFAAPRGAAITSCTATPIAVFATSSRRARTRVVSERATSHARAMAMGVLVDPSFAFPAADLRDQLSRLRVPRPLGHAAGGAVRRRARRRQPAALEDRRHAARSRASISSPLRAGERPLVRDGGEREAERLLTWPLSPASTWGGSTRRSRRRCCSINYATTRSSAIARPVRRSSCPTAP